MAKIIAFVLLIIMHVVCLITAYTYIDAAFSGIREIRYCASEECIGTLIKKIMESVFNLLIGIVWLLASVLCLVKAIENLSKIFGKDD
jgi:hypothetical protein